MEREEPPASPEAPPFPGKEGGDCPKPDLSVVVPAFDEAERIDRTVRTLAALLGDAGLAFEILVVDDGSRDDTFGIASRALAEVSAGEAIRLDANLGKGGATWEGFRRSRGGLVAFVDADLDIDPRGLLGMMEIRKRSGADVVVGSKRHPESRLRYPLLRRTLSRGYSLLVRLLFSLPVGDTQTGLKLFRREALEACFDRVEITGFAFDIELLARIAKNGFTIVEAPVSIRFEGKASSRAVGASWSMLKETLRLRRRLSREGRAPGSRVAPG